LRTQRVRQTQVTALALLKETVSFYSKDPAKRRAQGTDNFCSYATDDGRFCAVGRKLINPRKTEKVLPSKDVYCIDIERRLRMEFRGFPIKVWSMLQRLHDQSHNWETTGLSEMGKESVSDIKFWIRNESGLPPS